MKNITNKRGMIKCVILSGMAFILLASCNISFLGNDDSSRSSSGSSGILKINLDDGKAASRTILPQTLTTGDIATYRLTLVRSGSTTVTKTGLADLSAPITGLVPGVWTLTLAGYSTQAKKVAEAVKDVTITEGANTVSIALLPFQTAGGQGTLSVSFSYTGPTADIGNCEVILTKYPTETAVDIASGVTVTIPSVTINSTLDSGTYLLTIKLWRDIAKTQKHAPVSRLVQIFDNRTSSAVITCTAADLTQPPAAPTALTVSAMGVNNLRFEWTDNADTEEGYRIYRNGSVLADIPVSAFKWNDMMPPLAAATYEIKAYNYLGESTAIQYAYEAVSSITVAPSGPLDLTEGGSMQLTATVTPAGAMPANIFWSSTKPSVASVSSTGFVSANTTGTAFISAQGVNGAGITTYEVRVHGLVSQWDFENMTVGTLANFDVIPGELANASASEITIIQPAGASITADGDPARGQVLVMSGINSYAEFSANTYTARPGPWTVMAWVKIGTAGGASQALLSLGDVNKGSVRIKSYTDANLIGVTFSEGISDFTFAGAAVPDQGVWKHLAWVNTGSLMELYVNGVIVSNVSAQALGLPLGYLGDVAVMGGCSFPGSIDDLKVYDRAVSSSEIVALVNPGALWFGGGEGTAVSPFTVGTADHLNNVRNFPGSYFWQSAPIDLSTSIWANNWPPIQNFHGVYDGDHKTIGNLVTNIDGHLVVAGLFGTVSGAIIKNVMLTDVKVTAHSNVGALVGKLTGNSLVSECGATGYVKAQVNPIFQTQIQTYVGGLVGLISESEILRSFAQVEVETTDHTAYTGAHSERVGGLVGGTYSGIISQVTDSYATGSVKGHTAVGGLIGYVDAGGVMMTRTYASGLVNANTSASGGLIGDGALSPTGSDNHFDSTVSGQSTSWGGLATGHSLTDMTANAGTTFASWVSSGFWVIGTNYPSLAWQGSSHLPSPRLVPMVKIFGGTFPRTTPAYDIAITSFLMSKYEITRAQYLEVMGTDPSSDISAGVNKPVEKVSWYQALVFCNKLSMREGLTPAYTINGFTDPTSWGAVPIVNTTQWNDATVNMTANGYRLPTEAEWQFAARGNSSMIYPGSATSADVAWCMPTSPGTAKQQVGLLIGNGYGLYDMSGNVAEWCWDWYSSVYPGVGGVNETDPVGTPSGTDRITRGGAFNDTDNVGCTVESRGHVLPEYISDPGVVGLRVVRRQ